MLEIISKSQGLKKAESDQSKVSLIRDFDKKHLSICMDRVIHSAKLYSTLYSLMKIIVMLYSRDFDMFCTARIKTYSLHNNRQHVSDEDPTVVLLRGATETLQPRR